LIGFIALLLDRAVLRKCRVVLYTYEEAPQEAVRHRSFPGPCLIFMYVSVHSKKLYILCKDSYILSKEPCIRPTEVLAVPKKCVHI